MLFNSFALLSILWAGSALAKETPKLPGWTMNEQLVKGGHYVFTTVLEHREFANRKKSDVLNNRLVYVAKTAYEDLENLMKNYDDLQGYKKPELVAVLQKDTKLYIASTITRDSSHGVWNPATDIPEALKQTLYRCQAVVIPGDPDHKPANCAEAMALYLYFAKNPISSESDVRMSDATMAVWGTIDGSDAAAQEPCRSAYNEDDPAVFANSYGCKAMLKSIGSKSVHANIKPISPGQDIMAELETKGVCV